LTEDQIAIWDGELWRLITGSFVHAGILHLIFNAYWTWRFGSVIEGWMGSVRFLGFFTLVALGSSAAQFVISGPGVGLSGVAYGLFGILYALRRSKGFAAQQMNRQIVSLFVGWFILCVILTYTNVWSVGNVAHGAGAVLGWLVGKAILSHRPKTLLAGLSMAVLASFY